MAPGTWVPAYVGLGSNLDDPPAQLSRALEALGRLSDTRLVARSAFFRNPPLGPPAQPEYVNAVAGLLTGLTPPQLLASLQAIEDAQGRRRDGPRWGARTLDLDLLLHGESRVASEQLTLPHPGIAARPFVLIPLFEIAPGLRLPGGVRVATLAEAADCSDLVRLDA
jgi:2-amino-4-hydroxy-6-hydroxymethyldihydropteridine diphosphokinase